MYCQSGPSCGGGKSRLLGRVTGAGPGGPPPPSPRLGPRPSALGCLHHRLRPQDGLRNFSTENDKLGTSAPVTLRRLRCFYTVPDSGTSSQRSIRQHGGFSGGREWKQARVNKGSIEKVTQADSVGWEFEFSFLQKKVKKNECRIVRRTQWGEWRGKRRKRRRRRRRKVWGAAEVQRCSGGGVAENSNMLTQQTGGAAESSKMLTQQTGRGDRWLRGAGGDPVAGDRWPGTGDPPALPPFPGGAPGEEGRRPSAGPRRGDGISWHGARG